MHHFLMHSRLYGNAKQFQVFCYIVKYDTHIIDISLKKMTKNSDWQKKETDLQKCVDNYVSLNIDDKDEMDKLL